MKRKESPLKKIRGKWHWRMYGGTYISITDDEFTYDLGAIKAYNRYVRKLQKKRR